MRSLFDQYLQPDNRLTHALASTPNADGSVLRPFLRWAGGARDFPPRRDLSITEVAGELTPGDELESRGLPEPCVFSREVRILIESKGSAGALVHRHAATQVLARAQARETMP